MSENNHYDEVVYVEQSKNGDFNCNLQTFLKKLDEEDRFAEAKPLPKDVDEKQTYVWKIYVNKLTKRKINLVSSFTDECEELTQFIEVVTFYLKQKNNDFDLKLKDIYSHKGAFCSHINKKEYTFYLDITGIRYDSDFKDDYLFVVSDANTRSTYRNDDAKLLIPVNLVSDFKREDFLHKMLKVSCDEFSPSFLLAKSFVILGKSIYNQTILKWKVENISELKPCESKTIPTNIRKVGLVVMPPSQAENDFRSIFSKFGLSDEMIQTAKCLEPGKLYKSKEQQIVEAIKELEQECDVICIVRGGGNVENFLYLSHPDIFKELRNSDKYIVTGIGHANDAPLCQMVADYAAITPTDAAYHIVNMIKPIFADSLSDKLDMIDDKIQKLNNLLEHDKSNEILQEINQKLSALDLHI